MNIGKTNIDSLIKNLDGAEALIVMKRFLDDYFKLFQGSTKDLHALFAKINKIHPTIKFTMSHTSLEHEPIQDKCDCPEITKIPFVDVLCSLQDGRIITDLYKKDTDRNMYLLPSSCHPRNTTKSIPYSLGLRIVRICYFPEDRDKRLNELREQLLARNYNREMVDSALDRARAVPRDRALRKARKRNQTKRSVLAIPYDPRLPAITTSMARHWRSMTQDSYMKEVFPEPPLTAFKKQANIKDHIIRAKVAPPKTNYPKRYLRGMKKCGKCTLCPYIKEGRNLKINRAEWNINKQLNCNSYNVIYAIFCLTEKCKQVYIGETKCMLRFR